ncbi:glycosyltransferase [Streptococcus uberis]|uniref:glycosyltransferase family 2 protein n=1 Tax=Streptococcus uberis TaxID=1349 RepID=UPI001FF50506|nr:glycosyltransferase [Streptococcus uberis]MCK1229446.1 glycosyltransferase [Streptococcus uberis]
MISFILVNYINYQVTIDCVESILRNSDNLDGNFEIILVDNASPNNSIEIFKKKYKDIRNIHLIQNDINYGFGKANNIGVDFASGDNLIFVNSDVYFENFNFRNFSKILELKKDLGMLSCKILYKDGTIQSVGNEFPDLKNLFKTYVLFSNSKRRKNKLYKDYIHRGLFKCTWCSGSFFACRRDNYLKVGGFDESIFLYGEDLELGLNFLKSGFNNYVNDNFYAYHLHGASSKLSKPKYLKLRQNKLNDLYVFKKHNLFKNYFLIRLMIEFNVIVIYIRSLIKWLVR